NRELTNIEGVKIRYLIPGKAMLATIPWHKKATITVLGVYAPTESVEAKKAFWNALTEMWINPELDMPAIDWLGGDINLVVNPMDRLPQHEDDPKAVAALERFLHVVNLEDGWRRANPNAKAYTYTSTQTPPTHSRLDRIYVPRNRFNRYRGWSIDDAAGKLSDHKMVSVTVTTPGSPYIGKGRYTIPLHILHDREFRNYAVKEGAKLETDLEQERSEENNPQILFRDYKEKILTFARERAKVSLGATAQKKKKLQRERNNLLPDTEDGAADTEQSGVATKLAHIERRIRELTQIERDRGRLNTRVKDFTQRNTITKHTANLCKVSKPRDDIPFLRRTDTTPEVSSRRSDEMAKLARDYHDDLQNEGSDVGPEERNAAMEEVLRTIEDKDDSEPPDMTELKTTLGEHDVERALNEAARGKASGLDGIPTEFWLRMRNIYRESQKSNAVSGEKQTCDIVGILT
ncbi:hypothetical protein C8F01DRAFT_1332905, partial [Mycena amicta]